MKSAHFIRINYYNKKQLKNFEATNRQLKLNQTNLLDGLNNTVHEQICIIN